LIGIKQTEGKGKEEEKRKENRREERTETKIKYLDPLMTYPSDSNSPILSEVKPISPLRGILNPSRT
jgi:hypothetical protein